MTEKETLKYARNMLLTLHKSLIDFERARYEQLHGPVGPAQFLNLLLEDQSFSWLRKFSTLIVEIDEMFDLKDGVTSEMVSANLSKVKELIGMTDADGNFGSRYLFALQNSSESAETQAKLQGLLSDE